MSRLQIEHLTRYRYRQKVTLGPHRLVLRPREGHDLRLDEMAIEISPAHRLQWSRDVYNNCVAHVKFLEPAAELLIRSVATIHRTVPFPIPEDTLQPIEREVRVLYDVLEGPLVSAYQAISFPDDALELRLWLDELPDISDPHLLLIHLCSFIHRRIRYQRRSLKGVQTPAETLKLGSGSCRDLATLMMDAARVLGLAARFASGYLDCPASEAGRASTHAWTEVYLPVIGWKGYDPTLGSCTSLKHIPVGVSQHPRGVMPVTGDFRGMPGDYLGLDVSVKIKRLDTASIDIGPGISPDLSPQQSGFDYGASA